MTVAGETKKAFRYRLDRATRRCVTRVMNSLTPEARERRADFRPTEIQKILLVRSLFRMGDSILATPGRGSAVSVKLSSQWGAVHPKT